MPTSIEPPRWPWPVTAAAKLAALATGVVFPFKALLAVEFVGSRFGSFAGLLTPAFIAICIGALCTVLRIERITFALALGLFSGMFALWIPVVLVGFMVPVVFIPVLGLYAYLVPFTAIKMRELVESRRRDHPSEQLAPVADQPPK